MGDPPPRGAGPAPRTDCGRGSTGWSAPPAGCSPAASVASSAPGPHPLDHPPVSPGMGLGVGMSHPSPFLRPTPPTLSNHALPFESIRRAFLVSGGLVAGSEAAPPQSHLFCAESPFFLMRLKLKVIGPPSPCRCDHVSWWTGRGPPPDVLCHRPVRILHSHAEIYASTALAGAAVYVLPTRRPPPS